MPPALPVLAVIELSFSPIVRIGDWNVRLETLGLALVVFACLVVAVLIARRTPADLARDPGAPGPEPGEADRLRADDLLLIAVAALPGAVVAGRLGYVLLHLDYYRANPAAVLDAGQGGFELGLAVVGGLATAGIVAALMGAPVRLWMHAVILPLLLAIAAGKVVLVLGGDGQGLPTDAPWALAFLGAGPWGSLAPEVPSHPAQLYEAIATAVVLLVLLGLVAAGVFRGRNGAAFLVGIAMWALARALVATTWRDAPVIGPLNMGQLISLAIAAGAVALLIAVLAGGRRAPVDRAAAGTPEPTWPDPGTRPRI